MEFMTHLPDGSLANIRSVHLEIMDLSHDTDAIEYSYWVQALDCSQSSASSHNSK